MPKRQKYSNGGGPRNVSSVFRLRGNDRGWNAKTRVHRGDTTVEVGYNRPKGGGGYSWGSVGIKHIQGKNIFGFDVFGNRSGGGKGAQITWKREL